MHTTSGVLCRDEQLRTGAETGDTCVRSNYLMYMYCYYTVVAVISARLAAGCLPVAPAHLLSPEEEFTARVMCTEKTQYRKFETNIFPEKELRGLSPIFHIHVSVSDLNIFIYFHDPVAKFVDH